jgi:hypothetical protein
VAKPPRVVCIDEDLGNFQFGIDPIFQGLAGPRVAAATECQGNTVAGVSTLGALPVPHFPEIGSAMSCVKSLMAEPAPNTDRATKKAPAYRG